jgi:hypothetical protein
MVALAAAKSVIKAALRIEDDDFTLKPASPELFVATFRSHELRDRASKVSASQERPPVFSDQVGVPSVEVPPIEVPLREVIIGVGPTDRATVPPPHTHQIAVIPVVDSVAAMDDHLPPMRGGRRATSQPTVGRRRHPPGFTPPRPSTTLWGPTAAIDASNRHDLEEEKLVAFVAEVTSAISTPLVDKLLHCRRVDPVLVDMPPQLPSLEAFGLRRSHRQAVDPLSAVKVAKRGEVVQMCRLGEAVASPPMSMASHAVVEQFFAEGPSTSNVDALTDIFPMLRNKSKTSPFRGLRLSERSV